MNAYEKLCELGVILYQNKKYEAAISVLDAARKIQTNQKGITLRVLLTLANAHSQLMHVDTAISLFQETWGLALANHDHVGSIFFLCNKCYSKNFLNTIPNIFLNTFISVLKTYSIPFLKLILET